MTALQNGTQRPPKVLQAEWNIENDLHYVFGLLYILDNEFLYREVIYTS